MFGLRLTFPSHLPERQSNGELHALMENRGAVNEGANAYYKHLQHLWFGVEAIC